MRELGGAGGLAPVTRSGLVTYKAKSVNRQKESPLLRELAYLDDLV